MGRTPVHGECRVCGIHAELTYEHVPPRCAFNDEPLQSYPLAEWWREVAGKPARYASEQRGAGVRSLCASCNSRTGRWYVPEFCKWSRIGALVWESIPTDVAARSATLGLRRVYPARFAKQVLTMLLATVPAGFVRDHSELRELVLNRHASDLPERYGLYLSLFNGDVAQQNGLFHVWTGANGFSAIELGYPPFGYLLTIDDSNPPQLGSIGQFLDSGPDEEQEFRIELPINVCLLPDDIALAGVESGG